jgi:hypothetical protein
MKKILMADTFLFKQEIIFSSADKNLSYQIAKAAKEGKIKKIVRSFFRSCPTGNSIL